MPKPPPSELAELIAKMNIARHTGLTTEELLKILAKNQSELLRAQKKIFKNDTVGMLSLAMNLILYFEFWKDPEASQLSAPEALGQLLSIVNPIAQALIESYKKERERNELKPD